MTLREATCEDIPAMQEIRNNVKENVLSDPSLVPAGDYEKYLDSEGRTWVCEVNGQIEGFAAIDLPRNNVWALFVRTGNESKGIGRLLHTAALNWYFAQSTQPLWLSTSPNTRAERFYRKAGWRDAGPYGKVEIKFEMDISAFRKLQGL